MICKWELKIPWLLPPDDKFGGVRYKSDNLTWSETITKANKKSRVQIFRYVPKSRLPAFSAYTEAQGGIPYLLMKKQSYKLNTTYHSLQTSGRGVSNSAQPVCFEMMLYSW